MAADATPTPTATKTRVVLAALAIVAVAYYLLVATDTGAAAGRRFLPARSASKKASEDGDAANVTRSSTTSTSTSCTTPSTSTATATSETTTTKNMTSDSTTSSSSSIPKTTTTASATETTTVEDDSGKPSVIVTDCNGRLGNQMSAYGTIYALAKTYGLLPMIRDDQAQDMCFFVDCEDAGIRMIDEEIPGWRNKTRVRFGPRAKRNDTKLHVGGKLLYAGIYPVELTAMKPFLGQIKNVLQPHDYLLEEAQKRLEALRKQHELLTGIKTPPTFVGVHVRLTDYEYHLDHLFNLTLVDGEYLARAIDVYRQRFPNPAFVVVSDDLGTAWDLIQNSGGKLDSIYLNPVPERDDPEDKKRNVGVDLSLLGLMDHCVLIYGTFGMWGAIFAGGQAILPDGYEQSNVDREMRKAEMPGWEWI